MNWPKFRTRFVFAVSMGLASFVGMLILSGFEPNVVELSFFYAIGVLVGMYAGESIA